MHRFLGVAVSVVTVAAVVAGCTKLVDGTEISVFADPYNVAGLPATDGPSGLRANPPGPTREAENGGDGGVDRLALLAVSDIEEFWQSAYGEPLEGKFRPVENLLSWDSTQDEGLEFCRTPTFDFENAAFCPLDDTIGWDREVYLPAFRQRFGDMSIARTMSHEYGHYLQSYGGLVTDDAPSIVAEQQADCFAGVYMRWVAEGNSKRFMLSTGDGLNTMLAALIALRDPTLDIDTHQMTVESEHGAAFERISAFQLGFTDGLTACAAIDEDEIAQRRGDLPIALLEGESGELPVTEESVTQWVDALNTLFSPAQRPQLSFEPPASCSDARTTEPVSYCPATNTIAVDLPALEKLGKPTNQESRMLGPVFGDNTAFSVLTSRYMLAVQKERGGVTLEHAQAALRTACLTGVATNKFSGGVETPNGQTLSLSAGDLDEAVSGMLMNGLAASDVNGDSVPAGFSRVDAFRAGVLGDEDLCFGRYR